jgi:hypothetical protein
MAIYTPRGLKIRLSVDYAFPLIARLYPKVDAFKVLKTTEGIESLPTMVAFSIGLYCFLWTVDPINIGIATFIGYLAAVVINLRGFYFIPGLVALGTLYSYVSGFGILLIVLGIVGFFVAGWQSVLAFFASKFLAWGVAQVLEFIDTKRVFKLSGFAFTASERHFFNAYRLHASRIGVTTDIDVSEEEAKEENWRDAFTDLASKWPQVVARFTQN